MRETRVRSLAQVRAVSSHVVGSRFRKIQSGASVASSTASRGSPSWGAWIVATAEWSSSRRSRGSGGRAR